MIRKHIILSAVIVGLTLGLVRSVSALDVPPAPSKTAILDQANVIDDVAESQLSQKLIDYKAKTGNEIAILTIESLEGEDDFDYSYRVAQKWGIGSDEANNGALIFIAVSDRQSFIQVGRGLEPYLTDLQTSLIQRQKMSPEFKKGNYTRGIESGAQSIIEVIGGERLSESRTTQSGGSSIVEILFFVGFFVFAYLASFLARSKSWWTGGLIGSIPGVVLFFTASALMASVVFSLGLGIGLVLDYVLSKNYRNRAASGDNTGFWGSGGGFFGGSGGFGSGSGGFGGFGGGSFGGGGSGGSW